MQIILHQPEIPANTGNIGRTCVATGTGLHLIEPLGFRLGEKEIKRAGMDYWDKLDLHRYINFEDFKEQHPGAKIWMATTKAKHSYTDVIFGPDDFIMFGKESAGIPEEILVDYEETCIRIPMLPDIRSLNLSNSVAIVLYEALRQQDFAQMQRVGELHRLQWKEDARQSIATQQERKATGNRPAAPCHFIAPEAVIKGDVSLGHKVSVWHHAVVRGDRGSVRIGDGSNVQDHVTVHVSAGHSVNVGVNVTMGHGAIIHGCTIGDNTLVGMGAILMDGCIIGRNCIIGAGTLVTQNTVIPDNSLVLGNPGKVKRQVTEEEIEHSIANALLYMQEAEAVAREWESFPEGTPARLCTQGMYLANCGKQMRNY
ncbi:MAG: hypothetical protein IKL04_02180 [Lachnospiraceae bacterium]|nr:hypothetical protein [Lachnospiraceae bacterium]